MTEPLSLRCGRREHTRGVAGSLSAIETRQRIRNLETDTEHDTKSLRVLLHQVQDDLAVRVRQHTLGEQIERDVLADTDDDLRPVRGDQSRGVRIPRAVRDLVERVAVEAAGWLPASPCPGV